MSKYNGWTNYATWRVNLEMIDGYEFHEPQTAESLKEFVELCAFDHIEDGIAKDYARAFLSDVNWYEIANHVNEMAEL